MAQLRLELTCFLLFVVVVVFAVHPAFPLVQPGRLHSLPGLSCRTRLFLLLEILFILVYSHFWRLSFLGDGTNYTVTTLISI